MSINLNFLPPDGRSPAAIAYHIELYKRSMDTAEVFNPTEADFTVWNDRRVSREKWVVPNKLKDIGHGKGIQHVPFFVARRFVDELGMILINAIIKADWDIKKEEFHKHERGEAEQNAAIRSTDPALWDRITPTLYHGIVERYGGDDLDDEVDEQEQRVIQSGSFAMDAMDRLGIREKDVTIKVEDKKEELIDQIT